MPKVEIVGESYTEMAESGLKVALEATTTDTTIILKELYPIVEKGSFLLLKVIGSLKNLVGSFIDRNAIRLHKAGPTEMIPFADMDKTEYFTLFNTSKTEITTIVRKVLKTLNSQSEFKLLTGNPIFWLFWCCIRYYIEKG